MKKLLTLVLAFALIAVCFLSCGKLKDLVKPADGSSELAEQVEQIEHVEEPELPEQDEQVEQILDLETRCRTACNEVDVEGILDCLAPAVAGPMRTMLDLAGQLSGSGEEQVLDFLCQLLGAESSDHTEFCRTLETELSDIEVDGDKATASLHYTYEEDGTRYGADADVTFKRIDGEWYISKLKGK